MVENEKPDGEHGAPRPTQRWPAWKLALLLYPFTAAAVAINLFMLGLIGQAVGIGSLSPNDSVLWSIPIGIPAAWLVGRWVRGLMDEAA